LTMPAERGAAKHSVCRDAPDGFLPLHAGSAFHAPHARWCHLPTPLLCLPAAPLFAMACLGPLYVRFGVLATTCVFRMCAALAADIMRRTFSILLRTWRKHYRSVVSPDIGDAALLLIPRTADGLSHPPAAGSARLPQHAAQRISPACPAPHYACACPWHSTDAYGGVLLRDAGLAGSSLLKRKKKKKGHGGRGRRA